MNHCLPLATLKSGLDENRNPSDPFCSTSGAASGSSAAKDASNATSCQHDFAVLISCVMAICCFHSSLLQNRDSRRKKRKKQRQYNTNDDDDDDDDGDDDDDDDDDGVNVEGVPRRVGDGLQHEDDDDGDDETGTC